MAGGFIGDFVKGPVPDSLPQALQRGIRLHRRIDAVSNRLPGIATSIRRLDPKLRRVAPVLLDIVADHCLATRWDRHGHDELETFAATAYAAIDAYSDYLPPAGGRFFQRMRTTNLFALYRQPHTVVRAMTYVLQRLRHEHLVDELEFIVGEGLPALMDDFDDYFPDLKAAVTAWKAEVAAKP